MAPANGNDAQVRAIADSLFDSWQANQDAENKRRTLIYGSIPAWVACALSITAVLWQAAITTQQVAETTRRVEQLERSDQEQSREDKATTQQLARIEAKMDLIINERGEGK
jgi:uncharacterized protein YlxW (UPF0749 family)